MMNVRLTHGACSRRRRPVHERLADEALQREPGQDILDPAAGFTRAVERDGLLADLPELGADRLPDRGLDIFPIRGAVDDGLSAQPPLLPVADVDGRRLEERRLDNAAGGVSDHRVDLADQAEVSHVAQRREQAHARRTCGSVRLEATDDLAPVRVGIGAGQHDCRVRKGVERREQFVDAGDVAAWRQRDGMVGHQE